jgi:endoglycosylceramidase
MPAVNRAFDNLYANTDGILDEFAEAWSVMAGAFRDHPKMLGYDLFNEPYAGSWFPTCAQPAGCPLFDRAILQPVLDKLAAGVRTQDPATMVFYEPHIYFDFGAASWLGPPPAASGPAGFAFHVYCLGPKFVGEPDKESESPTYPTCEPEEEHVLQNAKGTAAAMGVPPLLDEFGDTQDLEYLQRVVDLADRHLMGWMYWSYKDWNDGPGGPGDGELFDDADDNTTLRLAKLRVLSRPYPQATAGTPLEYRFERDSVRFSYTYDPDASIAAPTTVFVPPIHYPDGYRVQVEGARVVSAPDAPWLELVNEAGAHRVHLTVTRP